MATEFNDASHYGFFMTGTTLTSATGKYIRASELVVASLRASGLLDNVVDGIVAPATDKLWLDKNFDPAILKEWNPIGAAWEQVTSQTLFGRVPWRGPWDDEPIYRRGDVVSYGGNIWIAVLPSQNHAPAEDAYWDLFLSSIADNSVSTQKLVDGAVTTAKLADDAITDEKIDPASDFSGMSFTAWTNGELRTLRERATDTYCILDAPGSPDPTGANESTASFEAMLAEGIRCEIVHGTYVATRKLVVPDGVSLEGQGGGYQFEHRTKILFSGTGTKANAIANATSALAVANPAAGAAYLADSGTRGNTYRTLDLASNFSAAVILGKGSKLKDVGLFPVLNGGIADYTNSENYALSDDWDVGVWADNADGASIEGVISYGHWRKSALLLSTRDKGDGKVPSCEAVHVINSRFQGFRGVTIRTPDVDDGSYGFAGTDFINCNIRPLQHQSAHLATSSMLAAPFASPSACLEMHGFANKIRGVQFLHTTFIGRDDLCIVMDKASEILFNGCYEESQNIRVSGSWLTGAVGSRLLATANSTPRFKNNTKYAIDFSPYQYRDGSLVGGRYNAFLNLGVCNASTLFDDDFMNPVYSTKIGYRMRSASQKFGVDSHDNVEVFGVSDTGRVTYHMGGGLEFPNLTTAELTSAAHAINTTGKFLGKIVFNTTTGLYMRANGSGTTSTWRDFANGNTITPV
ncbi:hypothetical protein SAMN02927900_01285 [Rhizobium mongolense subsp. loessense]|uniref:Tail spike TSP1/Gp66 N-terminal domain-containing protein n=1 Tax=Rhizobium mongolense subsp. loessense TaxID=158890 RepID=A0A1G4Q3A1_9HYPH|nr:hypothetical protein [Rhizobium mongolense]SCW38982.1 hypothetical protein SAMN02927900_01285 [Rhizobium mongolense subsp. loessense]